MIRMISNWKKTRFGHHGLYNNTSEQLSLECDTICFSVILLVLTGDGSIGLIPGWFVKHGVSRRVSHPGWTSLMINAAKYQRCDETADRHHQADTRRWINAGLTLVQRRRRWSSVKPPFIHRLVPAGHPPPGIADSQLCERWALVRGKYTYQDNAVYLLLK